MSTKEYPFPNAQQSPYVLHPLPPEEKSGIDLLHFLIVMVKHKRLILGMVFFAGFLAVNSSLSQQNIYRSEATIAPRKARGGTSAYSAFGALGGFVYNQVGLSSGGNIERIETVLNSRELTIRVIEEYQLMPVIFPKKGGNIQKRSPLSILLSSINSSSRNEDSGPRRTVQDAYQKMRGSFSVSADNQKQTIKLGYTHPDPSTAQQIVSYYLTELSETLRGEVLEEAAENKRFMREQINQTNDILLKEKLYTMLASEIEKETFARAQTYYSFIVLDPPIVPDRNKKVAPSRARFCLVAMFAAFSFAVLMAFFKDYIIRIRRKEPVRYQRLVRGLRLRKPHRSA